MMANTNITRKAIHAAFIELLSTRPIDRITVKDITAQCGISRNTFYYHYQDIPALLEDILAEDADRVVQKYPHLGSIEECIDAAMSFARDNKRIIMHMFGTGTNVNTPSLWRVCGHVISMYADTVLPDAPISETDRMLFIKYHKCALFGLVTDWINSGMKEEYLDGMHRICQLKKGTVELIIENAKRSL